VPEHAEREVVGDEHAVALGDSQALAQLVDDGFHDGVQLLVEEDLDFLHAERGEDRAGLLRVGLHPHEHGEQPVGPFVVGGVGGDLVADLALKDPHG